MGYVYLIEDEYNGVYKIGVTRKNDKKRLQKLQTGNANPLKLRHIFKTDWPFRLESMLHMKYKEYRVLNEWYELPEEVVNKFNEICSTQNDIIYSLKDNPFFAKNLK